MLLPFMTWAGELRKPQVLRADVMAGVTVALVLVPQSMAYAQLAGLPAYYGLYASFLPPMVAAFMCLPAKITKLGRWTWEVFRICFPAARQSMMMQPESNGRKTGIVNYHRIQD